MAFLLLFFLELLLLFFFSRFLTRAVSLIIFRLTRRESVTIWVLAILFFPGTVVHELAHFFTAVILFVRVGKMEFFPKRHGDGVKLGSVAIAQTDPFRRALIGLSPIFVGVTLLFLTMYYFTSISLMAWYINIFLMILCVFEIANTMFSSRRDVEGIPALLIVIIIFIIAGYFLGIRIPESALQYMESQCVQTVFQQLCLYLLIPLGIDGVILLLSRLIKN